VLIGRDIGLFRRYLFSAPVLPAVDIVGLGPGRHYRIKTRTCPGLEEYQRTRSAELDSQFPAQRLPQPVAAHVAIRFFRTGLRGETVVYHAVVAARGVHGYVVFLFNQHDRQIPAGKLARNGGTDDAASDYRYVERLAVQQPVRKGGRRQKLVFYTGDRYVVYDGAIAETCRRPTGIDFRLPASRGTSQKERTSGIRDFQTVTEMLSQFFTRF